MSGKEHRSLAHDLLVVAVLIFLLTVLVNRIKKYVHVNKHAIIHQIDDSIIESITKIQRHLGIVRQTVSMLGIADPHTKLARLVRQLTSQLHDLEQTYGRTAPSLSLIGPLGNASIISKEDELKHKLLYIALGINDACVSLLGKSALERSERKTITLKELLAINSSYTKELRHAGHHHPH